ncbi:MAG TPA: alpha/beta fold hydrolase [Kofleriaceae bacterium]|jgi:pimeloyl-ACP methyl ester carboxylesterase|nr:alpha/beta fold hydrolase [Kofleriaceae bacterium]
MQALHVVRVGQGPPVVLVHGSATDHTTWSIQLASPLRQHFELVTYDRRSTATVEDQADDLAHVIGSARPIVVGSSFGAVIALELARAHPERCRALVLIEPPMAPSDDPPDFMAAARAALGDEAPAPTQRPARFLEEFDRIAAQTSGPAAGEFFLRTVLGDAALAKMPRRFVERAKAKWAEIRADSIALLAYQPRYAELGAILLPVLLLGGERSAPYFRGTLTALAAALPNARLEVVARAGHMLHADAPYRFTQILTGFAGELDVAVAGGS